MMARGRGKQRVVVARHALWLLLREEGWGLTSIAALSGHDHSSVYNGIMSVHRRMMDDQLLRVDVADLLEWVQRLVEGTLPAQWRAPREVERLRADIERADELISELMEVRTEASRRLRSLGQLVESRAARAVR